MATTKSNETTRTGQAPACRVDVFTPAERDAHFGEACSLRERMLGYEQVPGGLRVFFDPDTPTERLTAFAERDRRCCAFLSGVDVKREATRVVLELATHAEGAAFWIRVFSTEPVSLDGFEPPG